MKRATVIDRRSLYIPRPSDWDWDKIGEAEIQRRLGQVELAAGTLNRWWHDVYRHRAMEWEALRGRLVEAKMGEVQERRDRIEALGKELRQIERLKAQAQSAMDTIRKNLDFLQ